MGSARTRASATSYANKKRVACSDTETVFNKVMQSMTYLPRRARDHGLRINSAII